MNTIELLNTARASTNERTVLRGIVKLLSAKEDIGAFSGAAAYGYVALVGVLAADQRERRDRRDVEVEQDGPIVDVVHVMDHALFNLLKRVGFVAPTVYLSPAGDAGLNLMASKVAEHSVVVEVVSGLGLQRVRARSDNRHLAA